MHRSEVSLNSIPFEHFQYALVKKSPTDGVHVGLEHPFSFVTHINWLPTSQEGIG